MRLSLHTRMFLTLALIIAVFGILCAVLGRAVISHGVRDEAQRRMTADLRWARSALEAELGQVRLLIMTHASSERLQKACDSEKPSQCRSQLEGMRRLGKLDFVGVTDATGRMILRAVEPYQTGDDLSADPFVRRALSGEERTGFSIMGLERLCAEGRDLGERASLGRGPDPKAKAEAKESISSAMALMAAAPVLDNKKKVAGVLYGGIVLNGNHAIADEIASAMFTNAPGRGRHGGAVTIFQRDMAVATNMLTAKGDRAIGIRIKPEVHHRILNDDRSWYGRAFVADEWYISAYDPIHDVEGKVIGMLYVGVPAKKYDEIRARLWKRYSTLVIIAAVAALAVGFVFSRRLAR